MIIQRFLISPLTWGAINSVANCEIFIVPTTKGGGGLKESKFKYSNMTLIAHASHGESIRMREFRNLLLCLVIDERLQERGA